MSYAMEYCVALPLDDVRERVREVFLRHGYAVLFQHAEFGLAERTSTRAESAFGFLAKHLGFRIRFSIGATVTVMQLERETDGWVGALLGGARHEREVDRLREALSAGLDAPCLVAA